MDVKTFKSTPETALSGLRMPSNLTEARELLANLTVQYLAGAISQGTLRVSAYAINSLVKAMAAEKAQELERRVHALEKLRAAK
jgi:glycerol kinase